MDIIGVDFSGAKIEGKTWVTQGHMPTTGCLFIDRIQPFLRDDLSALLEQVPPSTVVALDFPFSLPGAFIKKLGIPAITMREVWRQLPGMSLEEYWEQCKAFGTHPKRTADKHYSVSLSALNSRLVPMTYSGIKMLNDLDKTHQDRWWVPPLDSGVAPVDRITLLEVMPGAFLWSIGFDWAALKGPQGYKSSLHTRERVISQLGVKASIEIPNLLDFRWGFRANDDSLDSVVAALAAAAWATNQGAFLHPRKDECEDAQLEGWLYGLKPQP